MTLASFIIGASSLGTLAVHILLVLFGVAFLLRSSIASSVARALSPYAYHLVFATSLLGVIGSLFYSEFLGFEPCVLCWVARIFLYPIAIISAIAILRHDKNVTPYILGLAIPGAIVAFYQALAQLGGPSFTACTSEGGACSRVYVLEYGYITIPLMAFTTFLLVIVFMLIQKVKTPTA